MGRFDDKTVIVTLADDDIIPITDISDATDDKKITLGQIKTYSATDISGKQDLITSPTNNNLVATDALGQTKDSGIASSLLTSFNGNSQRVKTTSEGKYPALDGSLITNIVQVDTVISLGTVSSGTTTLTADKFHTVTFSGAATLS